MTANSNRMGCEASRRADLCYKEINIRALDSEYMRPYGAKCLAVDLPSQGEVELTALKSGESAWGSRRWSRGG
jgi:hypothetical protein